ncbi:glycosyltransferase family 2 protein [Brevibacillus sp. SYSU BS000544]|uniref:glycosyltransferase family 2 protein n=1 Tax=Brevibacillus sp. SYSU BS000544 TaxID=3416443 RepID=UPI003CE56E99
MPDVGIVMPVYHQRKDILRAAIRSISRQTYKNYKMIIVIDGITPGVLRVVRREARRNKRIQVVAYRQNRGTANALNVGFDILKKNPQIKYLTWVASDNIYYRNFIRILRRHLVRGPATLGLVYSNMRLIRSNGTFIHTSRRWQNRPKEILLDYNFILGSFLYKKEYAIATGDYQHTPVEDYDYWLRLTELCNIKYIPRALVSYRMFGPKSNSIKIRNNLGLYRHNRYQFHLVKHLARMRRGIPPETMVILPVTDNTANPIGKLEAMLEQDYSNFFLLVVNSSSDSQTLQALQQIPDSRLHVISSPVVGEQELIQLATTYLQTRFIYLHDKNIQLEKYQLENVIGTARIMYPQTETPVLLRD